MGDKSKVTVSGNLTNRLQIKYGVGLFDGLAEVTLRYRLMPQLYFNPFLVQTKCLIYFINLNFRNFMNNAILPSQHRGNVREIAAIDLGSNSFHMIIARIVNGSIQVLSRLKQKSETSRRIR